MAVQWGLANPGGGYDYLETLQTLGQQRALDQSVAARGYALQQQQAQDAARPAIQQRAASGDYAGASAQAFNLGDYDALKYVGGLKAEQHAKLQQEADAIGRLAASLRQQPESERAGLFQSIAPLLQRQGFTPQELASVNLSDGALDQYIALATDTKTALSTYAQQQEAYTLTPGSRRYANNRLVAENPAAPKYVTTPAGSISTLVNGGGGDPASTADLFSRVIGAESGGQQFAANGKPLTSRAGAVGIAQVMPRTAPEAARLAGVAWDEGRYRTDPAYNAQIGRAYFEKQLETFGDPGKAAAAYNAGPGRVQQAVLRYGDAWLDHMPNETKQYVGRVVGGPPAQIVGQPRSSGSGEQKAPSGYEWDGSGGLRPIRGGPADPSTSTQRNVQSNRKAEGDYRKEFNALPEVKEFNKVRPQFNTLRDLVRKPNPTAQDDIAIIFNYMKLLDPSSVVREGEFATAQNAAGIPDNIRNAYNRAQDGTRLNKQQRENLLKTAYGYYQNYRNSYNQQAENYRGYARDNGINADRVARTYTPDKAPRQQGRAAIGVGQSTQVGGFKVTRVK